MPQVFAFILHNGGVVDDSAAELASVASRIDAARPATALVTGSGEEVDLVCENLRATYSEVWKISDPALSYPSAEVVRGALSGVLPSGSIVLIAHGHFGVDLAPGLSVRMNSACVSDVVDLEGVEGSHLKLVRQEFGGQVNTHVRCDISKGAVITIRPGAFKPQPGSSVNGTVVDKSASVSLSPPRRRYVGRVEAETGSVDITKHDVLVSVGRGIQGEENIAIAQELADALGGAVSCSRPVVDAKWLDKSRQVGSSGKTVKPKVYMACGISGSYQHLAGIKGNPLLIAINKNPKAPIFRAATVGIVDDVLEFLPELTASIREK